MPSSTLNVSDLDGTNGFVINGLNPSDNLGYSVSSAGDINGDGFADLIIGAPSSDSLFPYVPGTSYVVFGGTDVGTGGSFDLSSLDGSNGFVINSIAPGNQLGYSVSRAGDINSDGIADLIIGAPGTSFLEGGNSTYVLFGNPNVGTGGSIDLLSLDSSNGFAIRGYIIGGYSASSAGDINGDGIDDLITGEPLVYSSGGYSYVVFGSADVAAGGSFNLSSLNGSNGFRINYYDLGDGTTHSVSGAGDINADGIDDLIIGVPSHGGFFPQGDYSVSYVVFGGTNVGADGNFDISSLDGNNGFVINGIDANDNLGWSVSSAGDINGDGIADLIIGAPGNTTTYARNDSSKSYVVFGGTNIGEGGSFDLSLLNGSNGFVINGINPSDYSGSSVSGAGDINGDGIADLIIGAPYADPNGSNSGSTYIVFGGAGVGAGGSFELSSLDGNNGFVLNGIAVGGRSGFSVSGAGDVNGDGIDDVIVGAPSTGYNGRSSGSSYVVFGSPVSVAAPTAGDDTLIGTDAGEFIRGRAGDDLLNGRSGDDILLGDFGNDTLIGGNGDDLLMGSFGNDSLFGGAGSDRFLLVSNLETDTIADFESGVDALALFGSLTFGQLDITQSNDDTLISVTGTGEVLATLTGVQANVLTAADFTTL
jgi:hypothetical protein